MKQFIGLKILKLVLGDYHIITIILNDGSSYTANINSFNDIYCYPTSEEWQNGFIGEFQSDIEWPNGFGIHLDQIASLSIEQNKSA